MILRHENASEANTKNLCKPETLVSFRPETFWVDVEFLSPFIFTKNLFFVFGFIYNFLTPCLAQIYVFCLITIVNWINFFLLELKTLRSFIFIPV